MVIFKSDGMRFFVSDIENRVMINDKEFRLWNDSMAKRYNPDIYHKNTFFLIKIVEKLRINTILTLLNVSPNDKILELGCGAGNLIEVFDKGCIFGLDLSIDLLNIAKSKRYNVQSNFIQSYGETTPFKSETFDKIYCSEVLEHVKDPKAICYEAYRLLKEKGLFAFSVPNERFINSMKTLMHLSCLDKMINLISKYKFTKDMTEEWHLHSFDLDYAKNIVRDIFLIEKIKFVPSLLFPVRIVVSCIKEK